MKNTLFILLSIPIGWILGQLIAYTLISLGLADNIGRFMDYISLF